MTLAPNFDYDLTYGQQAERYCQEVWHSGRHETKRKSYPDEKFYVELEQNSHGRGAWRPSGLATTEAEWFEFVIADSGIVVAFPVALLRRAIAEGRGRPAEVTRGDNPMRGRLIRLAEVAGMLS